MTQYAKLIDGQLQICVTRHISNPHPEAIAAYARANGYKPIIAEFQPHSLATPYYNDDGDQISLNWHEPELEMARHYQLSAVRAACDEAKATLSSKYTQAEVSLMMRLPDSAIPTIAASRGISDEQQQSDYATAVAEGDILLSHLVAHQLALEDAIKAAKSVEIIAHAQWNFDVYMASLDGEVS